MPELEQKAFQKRFIAYKVRISDILSRELVKDEFSAVFIKLNNLNVSRVNIIATVVYKSEDLNYASLVIDDGTGRVLLRSFENNSIFSKVDIGEIVLAIGKIREFNNEKYIIPEILKRINNAGWITVRSLELKNNNVINENIKTEHKDLNEDVTDINEAIYSSIRELDKGNGADIDDVVRSFNNIGVENIIKKMLENGEIFEIRSGKLKVLE